MAEQAVDPFDLPFTFVTISAEKKGRAIQVSFKALEKFWRFDIESSSLKEIAEPPCLPLSPDGKKTAFVRDNNIWVKDLSSGEEQALTH